MRQIDWENSGETGSKKALPCEEQLMEKQPRQEPLMAQPSSGFDVNPPGTGAALSGDRSSPCFEGLFKRLAAIRGKYAESELPCLSPKFEKQLSSNTFQLNLIEGHLIIDNKPVKSVYISSSFFGEGRTFGAISVAYALACLNQKKVLLIDTNERNSSIHKHFKVTTDISIQDLLRQDGCPEDNIIPTFYPNLFLITAREKEPLVNFARLCQMIEGFKQVFDYIIIDGKPVLSSSDFFKLLPCLDGIVLVVECEKTKWEVVQNIEERINKTRIPYRGVILNKRKFYMPKSVYKLLSRRYL